MSTVAVPRDALVERGRRTYVYKVNDGAAEQVTVEIDAIVGLWVGIAGGIEAGDQVIVRGAERLSAGQAVEIHRGGRRTPACAGRDCRREDSA